MSVARESRCESLRREIHVWFTPPGDAEAPRLVSAYRDLLAADEAARLEAFRFAADRHGYLVTRALVRTALSHYVAIDPRDWVFTRSRHGRPEIASPGGLPPLRFSVSHTAGLVLCAVTLDRELGIDAEYLGRDRSSAQAVADRFFTPVEARALGSLPEQCRARRFLEYWTLKEAYAKARGLGVTIPFDQLSFALEDDRAPRVSFDPALDDDPGDWQFAQLQPTSEHVGAVAVRRSGPDLQVTLRHGIPLRDLP